MTQDELSHVSGFSRFYISGIEGGRRNPTVHVLDVLAEALGVKTVDLLRPDRGGR
jgi:transcriptional regulator with XRE-family HTH domain